MVAYYKCDYCGELMELGNNSIDDNVRQFVVDSLTAVHSRYAPTNTHSHYHTECWDYLRSLHGERRTKAVRSK